MNDVFIDRMKNLLKDDFDNFVSSLKEDEVKGFYINPLKKDVIKHLDERYIQKHPYIQDGYYFDYQNYPLGKSPYFQCGLYYIQEPSAMAVASCLDIQKNDYVLDMCGAPGGKSCYVASRLSTDGLMITNDISPLRAKILASNIERFGLKNTIVTNCDPLKYQFQGFFDKIILDAPCSGEGMFRKDEEAVASWSMDKVNECAYIQRKLIDKAYDMLKENGILVYSTCTYSLEENEHQVDYMIHQLNMELIPIEKKQGMCDGLIEGTIRMYPHINRGEGQFIALLKKGKETAVSKEKILKPNLNREQLQLVQAFYKENLNIPVPRYLYQSNNHVYAIQDHFPVMENIKIVKNGLYLGECKKGRFEPSLSLALSLRKEDVKRYYDFSENSQEIKDYIKGLTLKGNQDKGYGLICVDGYPLSFYKESNHQIKNLYPKGLRR